MGRLGRCGCRDRGGDITDCQDRHCRGCDGRGGDVCHKGGRAGGAQPEAPE